MITTPNEEALNQHNRDTSARTSESLNHSLAAASTRELPLVYKQLLPHHPKAGLNPLSDAAASLFSLLGRIKQIKSYRHLNKLHQELMQAVQQFQTSAKAQGYSSEPILISRYALCATLDDLIKSSPWGSQGLWDQYSLLSAFHPDTVNPDRFFIILERLIREPALYIDVLELLYLCLNLGFEGPYRQKAEPYSGKQLDLLTQNLYHQIRAFRSDFHKNLSPYLLKPFKAFVKKSKMPSLGWALLISSCLMLMVMTGLGYSLGTLITQLDQDLKQIGKTTTYESHL